MIIVSMQPGNEVSKARIVATVPDVDRRLNIDWVLSEFRSEALVYSLSSGDKTSHDHCIFGPALRQYEIWIEDGAMGELI